MLELGRATCHTCKFAGVGGGKSVPECHMVIPIFIYIHTDNSKLLLYKESMDMSYVKFAKVSALVR